MKIIQKIIIWGNIFLLILLWVDIFIASIVLKPITIFLCQFSPGVLENFAVTTIIFFIATAWKVSKYGVFSGPYFPAFGLNTERYSVSLRIAPNAKKYGPEKTSILGHFSCSALLSLFDYSALLLHCHNGPSYCYFWGILSLATEPDGIFFPIALPLQVFRPYFAATNLWVSPLLGPLPFVGKFFSGISSKVLCDSLLNSYFKKDYIKAR